MRVVLIGFVLMVIREAGGQDVFDDFARETDSLNNLHFNNLKNSGQLDPNGHKTGFWTEYELLFDTTSNTATVVFQNLDYSTELDLPNLSTLQKTSGEYLNGARTGQWQCFIANYNINDSLIWKMRRETSYKAGMKHGTEREYDPGGIYHEVNYLNDMYHGTEVFYYPAGILYLKALYHEGAAKYGTWYYQTGLIKMTKDYKKYPVIKVAEHYDNGKIKSLYTIYGENEVLDGLYKTFDENGKLLYKTKYDNGVEMRK